MSHCQTGKAPVRLVMVVGVEGAGHNFLATVLDKVRHMLTRVAIFCIRVQPYRQAGEYILRKPWAPGIFLSASKVFV